MKLGGFTMNEDALTSAHKYAGKTIEELAEQALNSGAPREWWFGYIMSIMGGPLIDCGPEYVQTMLVAIMRHMPTLVEQLADAKASLKDMN